RREAAIKVAEGERGARILQAEGQREAQILEAEGERQALILRAEGVAAGLERIHAVARTLDSNTMSLEYLNAIKQLGVSDATKFVIPMEFTSLMSPLRNHTERMGSGDGAAPSEGA
ncbi:MAG: hypothetical protein GX613_09705, partial [Chloroflexi bacterium]|nr:hypothetical protein [Chloroflexota bacterium]